METAMTSFANTTNHLDALLEQIGLRRHRSALGPVLAIVGGAVAVGVVALLLTPPARKKIDVAISGLFGAIGNSKKHADGVLEPANVAAPAEKTIGQLDHERSRFAPTHQS